ncbi:hypothetical protein [Poseidonibacter lekithochrous]|uniref:hypothetical protein n=1 Tax=Poseidonibacter lekithochrous TaxID=1904463 RepID=UPI0008FCB065|nr:hypothetical protein [Poseidonibacter lekithochrous]QKJ22303.1 hypothetical protein ALEK_1023 [Poseidonibacter lekithochrous]
MNYLLAKLKGRTQQFLKVVASTKNIIETPDLSNTKSYSPKYKLEDDEWFKLDNFIARNYKNGLIENAFNGTTFNQITTDKYEDIKYLCAKQSNLYLFQKTTVNKLLSKKWLRITDSPSLQTDKPIIVINEWVDAVYDTSNDTLYFKDIVKIKDMFKGIESLYRTATQVEVNTFFANSFISLGTGFTSMNVKSANRRRIAMALDTLSSFTTAEISQVVSYTKTYCHTVPVSGNSFKIETEEHLKLVLFGIEQRYYTTGIKPEKRLANSILTDY